MGGIEKTPLIHVYTPNKVHLLHIVDKRFEKIVSDSVCHEIYKIKASFKEKKDKY
jgi:hypothetical protein